ncbi:MULTISPECIES: fimbrial protein [Paraburkholderia]|uniref:fimbrial protein n=1 Tax=Paraburkholderia TaxID=1822464 RepID=UPI0019E31523|nr:MULTISPECIES: fimbrial protein [Paraburkholderia]MDR6477163.1 major type 1 subunit fimbrin (pilin) [Paraburkholderia graminis]
MHLTMSCLMGLLCGAVTPLAHADSCSGGGQTITLPFPSTLTAPRDAVVGAVISPWVSTPWQTFSCSSTKIQAATFITASLLMSSNTGYSVSYSGYTFPVYATNYPGIGIAVGWQDMQGGSVVTNDGPINPSVNNGYGYNGSTSVRGLIYAAFVKTGPISGGTLAGQSVGQLTPGTWSYVTTPPTNVSVMYSQSDTAVFPTLNVVNASCTTPDVSIPLGTFPTTGFTAIGRTTTTANFSISLNNCPAGMNSIKYRIDPTTTVLNSSQSVVALDSTSSATGVGVQLLNSAGSAAFPLSSLQTFSGYSSSTGGSYTIPLAARYYQTSATVTPGPANTSMTVTMQYQ